MKHIQAAGIGSKKKQAEVISKDDEELLWMKGLLGDSSLEVLLDTIILYNGLHYALLSGKEHCQLRSSPCQIQVVEVPAEKICLT